MKKSNHVLDRLFDNMTEHLSRHPNDAATRQHLRKLGFVDTTAIELAVAAHNERRADALAA